MKYQIAFLPGDGVGPEVLAEARRVLELGGRLFDHTFEIIEGDIGGIAIDARFAAASADNRALQEFSCCSAWRRGRHEIRPFPRQRSRNGDFSICGAARELREPPACFCL